MDARARLHVGHALQVSGWSLAGQPHTAQRELEEHRPQCGQVARLRNPSEVDEAQFAEVMPHEDCDFAVDN
eukprot:14682955-Heterocapsa_arctica.AAC.1